MKHTLLPRARATDVLLGRAPVIGSRLDPSRPRALISPVESRFHMGIPYGDLLDEEARYLSRRSWRSDCALLTRLAVAWSLAPRAGSPSAERLFIVAAPVDNVSIEEALEEIFVEPRDGRARMVHFVHPHAMTLAATDPEHATRLARADLVLPDGIGLRVAATLLGGALRHNINGTDLLPLVCRRAAERRVRIALVGGAPSVAEECRRRLAASHPRLEFGLVESGYLDENQSKAVAARIRALGRCLVLVGMGSPKQEEWAWRHVDDAPQATVLTVGGLFDFYSGRIPRAPAAWRELGVEWVYRLLQEPRRLSRRYLIGIPHFLALTLQQRLSGRPATLPRKPSAPARRRAA